MWLFSRANHFSIVLNLLFVVIVVFVVIFAEAEAISLFVAILASLNDFLSSSLVEANSTCILSERLHSSVDYRRATHQSLVVS